MQIQEFIQPVMFHTQLNPKLWLDEDLKSEVHVKLLMHAREFIKSLKMDSLPLVDIIITGSNTNLTYTPQSDLDLHIIVDMDKVYNGSPLVQQFFDSKKRLWNHTYNVELYGIPVEIYVEDNDETVKGNVYSLMTNRWLVRQPITQTKYDDRSVRAKFNYLKRTVDRLMDQADSKDDLTRLMDRLRKYRQAGLDKHGEMSTENLAFKALRNSGYIDKIRERQVELTNNLLSLD